MPQDFTDRCMFPDHDPREDELTPDPDDDDEKLLLPTSLANSLADLEICIGTAMMKIDELDAQLTEAKKYDARTASVQAAVAWAIEDELDMDYGPGQIGNALDEGRRKPLDIAKWMGAPDGQA